VKKFTYLENWFGYSADVSVEERAAVTENLIRTRTLAPHVHLAWVLGLFVRIVSNGSAFAEIATPDQKKACTPDVSGAKFQMSARLPYIGGGRNRDVCGGGNRASAKLPGRFRALVVCRATSDLRSMRCRPTGRIGIGLHT
jgi:hypothetical protein